MNQEVKQAWCAALRSGKYKQGVGRLRHGDRYCCLGVLCDIAAEGQVGDFWSELALHRNWANLAFKDASKLSRLNDSGSSFSEIADFIEKSL